MSGKERIVKLLIKNGANIYIKDSTGNSAFDYAMKSANNIKEYICKIAYIKEAEKIAEIYHNRAGFFTIGMKKKANEIKKSIANVLLNLDKLNTIEDVANYKADGALSLNEALSFNRKFNIRTSESANLHVKFRPKP